MSMRNPEQVSHVEENSGEFIDSSCPKTVVCYGHRVLLLSLFMIQLKGRVYGVLSARNEAADCIAREFRTGSVYDNPLHKAIAF